MNSTENSKSSTTVMALPVTKARMFANSRTRATESPTLRASKYASGRASRCRNSRAPNSTSMRLVVCANTKLRKVVSKTSNSTTTVKPKAITSSVVKPRCTNTLSITTWKNSGQQFVVLDDGRNEPGEIEPGQFIGHRRARGEQDQLAAPARLQLRHR